MALNYIICSLDIYKYNFTLGYKAKLRYEGYELDNSKDFWINLCSNVVHPVGWCATRGKPLIPPKCMYLIK